jgi:polysaccharide biosynthesis protein PslH
MFWAVKVQQNNCHHLYLRIKGLKVLQLCHKLPFPPIDGGAQAIYYTTLGLIESGLNVKILAVNTPKQDFCDHELVGDFYIKTRMELVSIDTEPNLLKIVRNYFGNKSYFIERFDSFDFAEKLTRILREELFDIIQIEHLYLCSYINLIRKFSNAPIVFRPQNVEHVIWQRYIKNVKNPVKKIFFVYSTKRLKYFETIIGSQLDGIMTLTEQDANFFRQYIQNERLLVVPMGYKTKICGDINNHPQVSNKLPKIYHLGSMDWMPNIDAIDWYIKKIHPVFSAKCPEISVYIAGRKMPLRFFKYANKKLVIEGEIRNAVKYQQDKDIMIVPLISGSGIRAKIVEGLSLGKTIISTSIGAQGIRYTKDKNLIIADSAEEFANAMIQYSQSFEKLKIIGINASELAHHDHDYKKCARKMIDFYEKIVLN